ncbi:Ubiquinol-cytochrome c chaperone [Dillenia turbinata]|uniref:Ubiquinol-cytochrome c chaperone n=1 Tax=Dillenia turbinata TaxID=194707 RepID=A0AAN8ZDQ2_9MAGN
MGRRVENQCLAWLPFLKIGCLINANDVLLLTVNINCSASTFLASGIILNLEKTFKTTFSLLVIHMWLCLHRLKEDGNEGVEFGQYLYEIHNHDLELRVSKTGDQYSKDYGCIECSFLPFFGCKRGFLLSFDRNFLWRVSLIRTRWMKDLEKIFYGNIVAYDAAMLPEAKHNELAKVLWRNVFSDDGTAQLSEAASPALQAFLVIPLSGPYFILYKYLSLVASNRS